jgi:hypothetical protein
MNERNDLQGELRKYILQHGEQLHQLSIVFGAAIFQKNFLGAWAIADALPAYKELMLEQMGGEKVEAGNYPGVSEALPAEAVGIMARIADSIGELLRDRDLLGLKFFVVAIDQLRELFLKKLQECSRKC